LRLGAQSNIAEEHDKLLYDDSAGDYVDGGAGGEYEVR
jgi:hypothetical protein